MKICQILTKDKMVEIATKIQELIGNFDGEKQCMIFIQGCSTSGKSTLAKYLDEVLDINEVPHALIRLDDYYKTYEGTQEQLKDYDFDNPKALNWEAIYNTIEDYSDDSKTTVRLSKYSFDSRINKILEVENNHPTVIIVEGIYAFNIVNEYEFDLKKFEENYKLKQDLELFCKNTRDFKKFKILRIKLTLEKEDMRNNRVSRDLITQNFSEKESLRRFEEQIWPATEKLVNSAVFNFDIELENGSFNIQGASFLANSIFSGCGFKNDFTYEKYIESFKKCQVVEAVH